jgi:hypothetical protein
MIFLIAHDSKIKKQSIPLWKRGTLGDLKFVTIYVDSLKSEIKIFYVSSSL